MSDSKLASYPGYHMIMISRLKGTSMLFSLMFLMDSKAPNDATSYSISGVHLVGNWYSGKACSYNTEQRKATLKLQITA